MDDRTLLNIDSYELDIMHGHIIDRCMLRAYFSIRLCNNA